MIKDILDGLIKILGPIATLSKERRELKNLALRTISNALDETYLYYRDLNLGARKSLDREALLVKYWSAAAIPIRHFDSDLAVICDRKAEYWVNPDNYDEAQVKELGIGLNDVRNAYRKLLSPLSNTKYLKD